MFRAFFALTLATMMLAPGLAAADGAPPQSILRFAGRERVRLEAPSSNEHSQRLVVRFGSGPPTEIHRGPPVLAKLAVHDDAAAVAMVAPGAAPTIEIAVLSVPAEGAAPRVVKATAPWKGTADHALFAGVGTGDAEGFTFLWQEVGTDRSAVTHFARVRTDGTWLERPRVVEIPWSLAAIAPNGHGYHLALFFDGSQPGQTRLSFVTLARDGRPEQHPWWVSRPERVEDVQLFPIAGGVTAFYRGGTDGLALRSVDVTAVGTWGTEPAAPTSRGAIAEDERYALRKNGDGKAEVVRNP